MTKVTWNRVQGQADALLARVVAITAENERLRKRVQYLEECILKANEALPQDL